MGNKNTSQQNKGLLNSPEGQFSDMFASVPVGQQRHVALATDGVIHLILIFSEESWLRAQIRIARRNSERNCRPTLTFDAPMNSCDFSDFKSVDNASLTNKHG